MLIEGMRIFYPKLYETIRGNPDYFLRGGREVMRDEEFKQRVKQAVERALEADGVDDKELVRRRLLEVLFPRLKGIFGNTTYGPTGMASGNESSTSARKPISIATSATVSRRATSRISKSPRFSRSPHAEMRGSSSGALAGWPKPAGCAGSCRNCDDGKRASIRVRPAISPSPSRAMDAWCRGNAGC